MLEGESLVYTQENFDRIELPSERERVRMDLEENVT